MKYEDWERNENERLAKSGEKRRRYFTIDELADKREKLEEELAALKISLQIGNEENQNPRDWHQKVEGEGFAILINKSGRI